ncbi:MAG: hypothetical protein AAF230_03205 [Pseudomonadota bacterium]
MAEEPSENSDIERSRRLLCQSDDALQSALDAFAIIHARINAGDAMPDAEMSKTLNLISQGRGRVRDDMRAYEDRILYKEKRVANAPLDFDELRAALGSKLDRIRRAAASGDVSE